MALTRTPNEGLASAPTFTPHRVAVTAADPTLAPSAPAFVSGLESKGFQEVIADVKLAGTGPSVTIEVVFWSEQAGQFVRENTNITATMTSSQQFRFLNRGRRFYIRVSAISGAGAQADIAVAGAPFAPEEFA